MSISQPAVTAQIRKLEAELGLVLVEPRGRGIALTHAGQFLYEQGRRIYDLEKELEKQLDALQKGTYGKLRIASTFLPSHYLVPTWLASYKRQFDQVDIEIRTGNSQQSIERLLRCQADLAIITNESWDERPIRRHHLTNVAYWFIVPAGHPFAGQEVALEELTREPFLLREQGSSTRELDASAARSLPFFRDGFAALIGRNDHPLQSFALTYWFNMLRYSQNR